MRTTEAAPQTSEGAVLTAGARLAGRFQLGDPIAATPFGTVYRAVDTGSNRSVELVALSAELTAAVRQASLDESVSRARSIASDRVAQVLEHGVEGSITFAITAAAEGHTLEQLLARKKQTGARGFAPRAAGSIVGKVADALAGIHDVGLTHGWIGLTSVRVDKSGEVTVTGAGLAPVVAATTLPRPTRPNDIAALGALLYHLLVGEAPSKGCPRPSQVVTSLDPAADQLVAASMHPDTSRRPASAEEFRGALTAALAGKVASSSFAPESGGPARPSLAESLAGPRQADGIEPESPSHSGQLSAMIADPDEAWLVNKDRLDYGPFTMIQVIEMIQRDEILPGHEVINKHSGDRTAVEEHPLLGDLVEEARMARDERRRAQAEVVHAKTEKRRGALLYVFIAAAVIGLAGGAYLIVNAVGSDDSKKSAGVGSLEEGELKATISFPTRDDKRRGKRSGKRGKRSKGGVAGGWDDTVDLGDASEDGGDERLSDAQINPVVQSASGRLGGCLSRNGGGRAAIWFIVKGTGRVAAVKVNGKTNTPLANCIRGVMQSLKFPSFDGIRTKANFTMSF
jgi:hypothetical protein